MLLKLNSTFVMMSTDPREQCYVSPCSTPGVRIPYLNQVYALQETFLLMACLLQHFEFLTAANGQPANLRKSHIGLTRAPERFRFRIRTIEHDEFIALGWDSMARRRFTI